MAFLKDKSPREYLITTSQTLAVPIGAYIEVKVIGGGKAGGTLGYGNSTAGGNSSVSDGMTTITATGGNSSVTLSGGSGGLLFGFGKGGKGVFNSDKSFCVEKTGENGELVTGSFVAASTSLSITIGSGSGGYGTSAEDGTQGAVFLRIYPYGQPNDGLPAHP